jgi:oligogalacturonide lyase
MKYIMQFSLLLVLFLCCSTQSINRPKLISKIQPAYPIESRESGIEGNVEMNIRISESGNVDSVVVINSSGSEFLDYSAKEYGYILKFEPIKPVDKAASTWTNWIVIFRAAGISDDSYIGKLWLAESETWIDDEYGHEVTKWTSDSYKSWHLYFNIESFIDDTTCIIYSNRTGGVNLYKLNLIDGSMLQMTNYPGKIKHTWHLPEYNQLYFEYETNIHVLNTITLEDSKLLSFENFDLKSFTVTSDRKYIVYTINKNPGWDENHSTGPFAIFRYEIATGEKKQISPDWGISINHLQANPVNPNLIVYSWQHQYRAGGAGIVGNVPIRFWWINVDGSDGGPVGPQEFGLHRTHEFWTYDGSRIGYSARYKFGEHKGRQFLGSCLPDGTDNFMIEVPVGPAHSQIYKDSHHWVADLNDGTILTMWTFDRENILNEEKLFNHNSSWEGQPSHPHPHFSPDGKYVLFSTDKTGTPCVYTVKVNLDVK